MTDLTTVPLKKLLLHHPYAKGFFVSLGIKTFPQELSATEMINTLTDSFIINYGLNREEILHNFYHFMQEMQKGSMR